MRRTRIAFLLLFIFICFASFAQTAQTPKLNHVSIYIKDLAKSAEFYQNIVQLKKIPDPFNDGHHIWLSLGENLQLHLIQGPTQETIHEKRTHICLSTPSLEDFIARLEKNKVNYSNLAGDSKTPTTRPDGVKQIYFQDPDGFWIEMNNEWK